MSAPPRDPIPDLKSLPLVIETARLRLRPVAESDAEAIWPHASDPRLSRYVSWAAHVDIEETRAFLRAQAEQLHTGSDIVWGIEHEGQVSGCIGLHGITWAMRALRLDRAELGYWLALPLWNRGLITEAATAVTRWGFETLGLHKITVGCLEDNLGSRRVIEKIGFRFLCRQEEDYWRDGRWHAHLRYELLASEWSTGDIETTMKLSRPRRP